MNFWNRLVFYSKYLFGGFESASDYLLIHINKYLDKTNVADKVQQVKKVVDWVIKWLEKLSKYCPEIWRKEYEAVIATFKALSDALADGQLSKAEIQSFVEGAHLVYDQWMAD